MKLDQKVFGKYVQSTIWPVMRKIEDDKVYQVVIKECNGRSIPQNSISHAWYNEIAETLGDRTPLEAKCESKLFLGVPILRAEDEDFRESYDRLFKNRFNVEEKLEIMKSFEVTSLMEKPQFTQYLEAMREHWGKAGVTLLYPEDLQRIDYPESKRA